MARQKKGTWEFRPFESRTKTAKHLRLTANMTDSAAWARLSVHAMIVYVYMKAKYNHNNERDISFTYAEAQKLMHKATFTKAIDELIESGFIELVEQNWTARRPNIYGFSHQWQLYGTDAFSVKPRHRRRNPGDNVARDPP